MRKLTLVFVAAVSMFTFGCKKGGGSDVLAKMEGFQKQMCECKDKACADKVQDDMTKWGTEAAKTAKADEKPDPEMVKKSGEIMTKYTECMTKLMTAAMTPPPGDKKPDDTAAKPDDKKPDDTAAKPVDDKKPDDTAKPADDKKPAGDKKAGDKKPDDKKAGGW